VLRFKGILIILRSGRLLLDLIKLNASARKTITTECPYTIKNKTLSVTTEEKNLGIWVTSNLSWSKHTLDRCAATNRMLEFVRRSAMEITDKRIRRALYLAIVPPALGYATQVWSLQSVELINRVERVQRRASKFIIGLPLMCDVQGLSEGHWGKFSTDPQFKGGPTNLQN
jgi:hypothetical protein